MLGFGHLACLWWIVRLWHLCKSFCRGTLFVTQISLLASGWGNCGGKLLTWTPLESDNKLVTYHSLFACPLLNLQADSRTRVRNGGASLMPLCYLHLYLPMLWIMWAGFVCVHILSWRNPPSGSGNGQRDKCSCAAVQNEVLVLFHCQACLSERSILSFLHAYIRVQKATNNSVW